MYGVHAHDKQKVTGKREPDSGNKQKLMSEFVNYNKRSINLPPGCKDLIDVLRPAKASKTPAIPVPGVSMSEVETGTLSSIRKHIEKFLQSRQMLLVIYTADEQVAFDLERFPPSEPISASMDFVESPVRYESIKTLFARFDLELAPSTPNPPTFIPGAPVWVTIAIHPFPSNTPRLVEVATAVFRELCSATDDTPLHFRHYNVE